MLASLKSFMCIASKRFAMFNNKWNCWNNTNLADAYPASCNWHDRYKWTVAIVPLLISEAELGCHIWAAQFTTCVQASCQKQACMQYYCRKGWFVTAGSGSPVERTRTKAAILRKKH
eukprot:3205126-Amphidinium_carterae.1